MSLNTITLSSSCLFSPLSLYLFEADGLTRTPWCSSTLASQSKGLPIDKATLLQILQKGLSEWFGTAGGVNSNEIEIVKIQEPLSGMSRAEESDSGDREVILRFPRSWVLSFTLACCPYCSILTPLLTLCSITPQLLTALPLLTSSTDRIRVLNDSSDLSRFAGFAGRGKNGFKAWKTQLSVAVV